MKMQEAMRVMEDRPAGFMVRFSRVRGYILDSDHFPDAHIGEPPIPTEAEAWDAATRFAARTRGRCVDVFVIQREGFSPVPGYLARMISNR